MSEDGSAVIQAAWTNRRPEARTVLPGDRLLYISRKCPSPDEIQRHLQEVHHVKPQHPDGGVHQLDAVRPDEEEDWKSVIDEDDDQYAFFYDDEDSEGEAWNDGGEPWEIRDSRGTSVLGHRSPAALCRASSALWDEEAPAQDEREAGEFPELNESTPTPVRSPSPPLLQRPTQSPSPLPVEPGWLPELNHEETYPLPKSSPPQYLSPLPSEPDWPPELEFEETYPLPMPSPSPFPQS